MQGFRASEREMREAARHVEDAAASVGRLHGKELLDEVSTALPGAAAGAAARTLGEEFVSRCKGWSDLARGYADDLSKAGQAYKSADKAASAGVHAAAQGH
ncbi:hypothetical protein KEM60_02988 [Austwickia sp. TVS 96-490-7B]|uniref:hypothetical protein n=1 Tax=Austwickia sp. TVS 96-490-7B TaxID=2830843 RepID=UPI001C59C4A4|nr:hypothetical protein [Austwickia sp. TVS 96-490-7B]MBW3086759.1 hypothetical protein [Austwickia sp. TVS 96-490-7B]